MGGIRDLFRGDESWDDARESSAGQTRDVNLAGELAPTAPASGPARSDASRGDLDKASDPVLKPPVYSMERETATWGSWFPLLAGPEFHEWRDATIADTPFLSKQRLIRSLADSMVEKWASFQWAKFVPTSDVDSDVRGSGLSVRAKNTLLRNHYDSLAPVLQLSARDIYDMRGAGARTVHEIAEWVLSETIDASLANGMSAERVATGQRQELHEQPGEPEESESISNEARELLADFGTLAQWMAVRGLPAAALLADETFAPAPVQEARGRIAALSASGLPVERAQAARVLGDAIEKMSEAAVAVASKRMFADEPATLQAIAEDLGVSRERVRQIETTVFSSLSELIGPGGALNDLAVGVARRVDSLLPLADVLEAFPTLSERVDIVEQPLWRVIDRLDPAYEIEDAWCASPSVAWVKSATVSRLDDLADEYGLFALDRLSELGFTDLDQEVPGWLIDWLDYCGVTMVGSFVLTRTSSLQDRAAAALAMVGEPMTVEGFPAFVVEGRSPRSLANAMATDERFHRVDRARWALAEWGLGEYRGIADAIGKEIDESGGSIPLDVLTHRLVQRFEVAETSVRAYASAPPYAVENGVVRRSARGRDSAAGKSWKKTRRVYRRPDGLALRITVTSDHMRGSGSPCPVGLARELGVKQGERADYGAATGSVGVFWTGMQPTLGSVTTLLQETDAEVGDTLMILFRSDFRVEAWAVDLDGASLPERLLRSVARNEPLIAGRSLSAELAEAIGMPPESSAADLVAALEARGDHDIAELFLSVRDTAESPSETPTASADVEDILGLL